MLFSLARLSDYHDSHSEPTNDLILDGKRQLESYKRSNLLCLDYNTVFQKVGANFHRYNQNLFPLSVLE